MNKTIFILLTFLMSGFAASAQTTKSTPLTSTQKSGLVVTFEKVKGNFSTTATGSTTLFVLTGTDEQVTALKNNAAKWGTFTLETKRTKSNTYSCKLVVTSGSDTTPVQRAFSSLGLTRIKFEGQEKTLNDLANILGQLQ